MHTNHAMWLRCGSHMDGELNEPTRDSTQTKTYTTPLQTSSTPMGWVGGTAGMWVSGGLGGGWVECSVTDVMGCGICDGEGCSWMRQVICYKETNCMNERGTIGVYVWRAGHI